MSSKKGALIISLIVVLSTFAHAQFTGSTAFVPSVVPDEVLEELYDLQQKVLNMQEFLAKFNMEFSDMKSIVQDAIDAINDGNFAAAIAHLENLLDYIDLIDMQKSDLHDLVSEFDSELGSFSEGACDGTGLCDEGDPLPVIVEDLNDFVISIEDELININEILGDGGFESPDNVNEICEGSDVIDYINCAISEIESEDGADAIILLEDGVIAAINAAVEEKENIENNKVSMMEDLLEDAEDIVGEPIPPPFNPDTIVFDDLQEALDDITLKAEELEGILGDIDDELGDILEIIAEAKTLIEEGIDAFLEDDFDTSDEKFKEAIRLIIRAETIKHIINGPFTCGEDASDCDEGPFTCCTVCNLNDEGCPDGIKVQEFEELKFEIENELVNDVGEGEGGVSALCNSEFIDERRCNKFDRAISSAFELLSFINSEMSLVRDHLSESDLHLDDAIGDLESAIESDDGEAASSALGDLDDAEELIERAIIKKEFIENQKLDKLDFFLDQIIDDVGTQENDPVNEILLGDVKEEWFNIQVKLIWLNDLLKGLNEQIGFAEEDIEEIFFIFEECLDSEDVEECPDSELEFITILLNNVVNSIVRVILALVDVEEVENLIDDIREEKAAVELQIDTLCSADAIDNERICDKLQRKLTGMNKALDYIDEELEEIVDELGDSLDDLFSALFFILDEIGLFSEEPPEISSDNYVEVIDQLYQTLGQAVSNGIPAQSIKPAQLDEFLEMLADARDDIRDAKSIKETIELHKFPVLFERFRSFEETIGGSVKPDEVFGDTDFEAKEARHIQTKVLRMFSLLHLINVHAAEIEDELIEFFEESDEDFGDTEENFFAIVEKFDALVELKDGEGGLVDEIGDLESEIIGEIDSGDLSEVTGAHILRNIDKIQSLADLINIEFSIMGFLLEAFGNTCCDFDSFIFLTLFIAEKEAIEEKKLVELEEALVEIENALLGCDDDDHDELFENPFCFRNCGFDDLCGDGKVQFALGEQCDDGNNVDNDACTNDCRAPECGDGIVQAGEECDDGNVIDGDGCSFDCKIPDPDGDGICDEGDSVLPCQWNEGCDIALDCGFGGACDEGSCECPGLKCEDDDDCVGKIDCSSIGGSCNVPGNCEFCSFDNGDVGECVCGD